MIANGLKQGETILDIVRGKQVGTFITKNGHVELDASVDHMADEGMLTHLHHCMKQLLRHTFCYCS